MTSGAHGLFKLSINVSLKKDLNYIDEFKSRADGGKLRTKLRLRAEQPSPIRYQNRQSSLIISILFTAIKDNTQSESG